MRGDGMLESFLLAALTPVLVIALLRMLRPAREPFDLHSLAGTIRRLDAV